MNMVSRQWRKYGRKSPRDMNRLRPGNDETRACNKQILFISHMFPPQGGPGVQRSVKFVKYLPQFGWDSVVLTPRCTTWSQRDETLLKDIPPGTTVMKTYTAEPKPGPKGVFHYIIWGALKPLSVPDRGNWCSQGWCAPHAMPIWSCGRIPHLPRCLHLFHDTAQLVATQRA